MEISTCFRGFSVLQTDSLIVLVRICWGATRATGSGSTWKLKMTDRQLEDDNRDEDDNPITCTSRLS